MADDLLVCSILRIWDTLLRNERQSGCLRPGHVNLDREVLKSYSSVSSAQRLRNIIDYDGLAPRARRSAGFFLHTNS